LEVLKNSLGEKTGSKALFRAATYTIRMRGGSTAVPTGVIAELLDTNEIGVEYETSWSVNSE